MGAQFGELTTPSGSSYGHCAVLGYTIEIVSGRCLGVQQGDTLFLTDAPDGSLRITPYNPDFKRQMALAEQLMHDDREILRVLAK